MPGNDTNVSPPSHHPSSASPPYPTPSSQTQQSSDLAAGYLANHAKLILVLLKPGDYGGFPLCLFVWMLNYQYVIGICIVMSGAYSVACFAGM